MFGVLYSTVKLNYTQRLLLVVYTMSFSEILIKAPSPVLDFPALNFGVKSVRKTSVLLTWDLPQNYKPQTPFKVSATKVESPACDAVI